MTADRLARDHLRRARARRATLRVLLDAGGHADVVRESQDIVELILKGALRFVGVDPPRRHDVHGVVGKRPHLSQGDETVGPASKVPENWGDLDMALTTSAGTRAT